MKVFVWKRIASCTANWHKEGGIVVFAETEERARKIAISKKYSCEILEHEKPDEIREVVGGEEKVYRFQDTGCC